MRRKKSREERLTEAAAKLETLTQEIAAEHPFAGIVGPDASEIEMMEAATKLVKDARRARRRRSGSDDT